MQKKKQSPKARKASLRNLEVNEGRQRFFWLWMGATLVLVGFLISKYIF